MNATRKTRSVSQRVSGYIRGIGEAIPAGLPPVLRRFWKFTRDNSKQFAKHLREPQKREEEFNKVVIKKFKT